MGLTLFSEKRRQFPRALCSLIEGRSSISIEIALPSQFAFQSVNYSDNIHTYLLSHVGTY